MNPSRQGPQLPAVLKQCSLLSAVQLGDAEQSAVLMVVAALFTDW